MIHESNIYGHDRIFHMKMFDIYVGADEFFLFVNLINKNLEKLFFSEISWQPWGRFVLWRMLRSDEKLGY